MRSKSTTIMIKLPKDIELCIDKLDQLQFQIFDVFDEILNVSSPVQALENDSIELTRSKLSKQCTKLIIQYQEMFKILETKANNHNGSQTNTNHSKVVVDLYREKLNQLKHQLKETELQSYRLEEEFIHKQRIHKFGTVPERQKSFEEMKHELFKGRSESQDKELQEKNVEEKILQHNKSITATLQNTRQLMTTSIIQTELNIDSLDQQSKDLSNYDNLLSDLTDTLKKSRNIVKFIEKQDRSDKRRIYLSIFFLLACCAWVIWRRILKVPVKIFLWSLLKVFRIITWLLPTMDATEVISSQVSDLGVDTIATIETIAATGLASVIAVSSSLQLGKEIVVDYDNEGSVRTWEEILETTVVEEILETTVVEEILVKDEL